jgi:tRNA U34 5-methylaminomethyl-2-thiouridine-forming methyltransferase MnmC
LLPNAGLDGDTGAAFAVTVSDGIAISEINARAAMNFLMTHLLVAERRPASCNNNMADRHALQSLRR